MDSKFNGDGWVKKIYLNEDRGVFLNFISRFKCFYIVQMQRKYTQRLFVGESHFLSVYELKCVVSFPADNTRYSVCFSELFTRISFRGAMHDHTGNHAGPALPAKRSVYFMVVGFLHNE